MEKQDEIQDLLANYHFMNGVSSRIFSIHASEAMLICVFGLLLSILGIFMGEFYFMGKFAFIVGFAGIFIFGYEASQQKGRKERMRFIEKQLDALGYDTKRLYATRF